MGQWPSHSWQRVPTLPLFYEYPLYCLSPTPFQMLSPFPRCLQPPPHCSLHCLVPFAERVVAPHLMCYFT